MGFLSGRVSYSRFQVVGSSPLPFGEETLEAVERHVIGRQGEADPTDGVHVGWSGGRHVLDATFDLEKNVLGDALHLGLRIDADAIPGDLLKAYEQIELEARIAASETGRVSKAMRQEAKEAAKARAQAEAADGRFRRRKMVPMLWDGRANLVYVGSSSSNVVDRLRALFRDTFDLGLEPITAGSLALEMARGLQAEAALDEVRPLALLSEEPAYDAVAWTDQSPSLLDYWGNEFLVWLWGTLEREGDTIALPDGSTATVMVAKTLTLDCPRGETGRDRLTTEGPTRQPEAFRALQAGKLPRQVGLMIVRHGIEYSLTLQAESFSVAGAGLPKPEESSAYEAKLARIDSLRHLAETLDQMFETYVRRRLGPEWNGELGQLRSWLKVA